MLVGAQITPRAEADMILPFHWYFRICQRRFFHDLYPTSSSWPTLIQFTSAVIFNAHPRISSQFHRCTVAFLEELSNDFQVVNLRLGVPKEINTMEKSVRSGRRWDKKGTGATTSVFLALVGTRNHLNSIWTMIVGKGEVEVFVKCLPMLQCQKSKNKKSRRGAVSTIIYLQACDG